MRLLLPHIHFQIFAMILLKFCTDVDKADPDGPGSSSDLDCFVLCRNLIFFISLDI